MLLHGAPIGILNDLIQERNIVDQMYWALKDPNVIDKGLRDLMEPHADKVEAATFSMQTGYYVGNGTDNRPITNIGFSPDLVLIKDNTTAGSDGVLWRSSVMTSERTAKFEAEADITSNAIQSLDSTGFTLGTSTDVNSANVLHYWVAFDGSDCTASGTFCVGSYTGNGTTISPTTGFQPDLVVVKRSGASAAVWKSSSMGANDTNYMINTNVDTTGQMIQTLNASSFTVGNNATVNTASTTYWFFAFKQVSGYMDVGTFSGNGVDSRNITTAEDAGLTFKPDFLFVKSANPTTATTAVYNIAENYGDRSFLSTDAASAANHIQKLNTAGFQVGSSTSVNGSGNTIYYAAFAGNSAHSASGTFSIAKGSYTGTGTGFSVTGVGFAPDLVIIKHNDQATDQYAVFKTKMMKGDLTGYFATGTTHFTGGITALGADGFTIGTSATVNTASDTYYWTAFGNAWDYEDHSGAADFAVGYYIGTAQDNNNINRLPFQPNFVSLKHYGTQTGVWRTSNMSGDTTQYFSASPQAANLIQLLNSDGFQLGSSSTVNGSGSIYHYFMFKTGTNFTVNNYTGNGTSQDITSVGFSPDLVWLKKSTGGTARGTMLRTSTQTGDALQPFLNGPTITGGITALLSNGFSLGSAVEANESTYIYRYAAWRLPVSGTLSVDIVDGSNNPVASPGVAFSSVDTTFSCQTTTGTFGTATQKIRVSNTTAAPAWTLTLAALSGATTTWSTAGTEKYDFNDNGGSPTGCGDSGDSDSYAGQLSLDFSGASITAVGAGCTNTGVTLGSNASYLEGSQNNITIASASGSANTNCSWDITGIGVNQKIPKEQPYGSYSLNMSLTVIAN